MKYFIDFTCPKAPSLCLDYTALHCLRFYEARIAGVNLEFSSFQTVLQHPYNMSLRCKLTPRQLQPYINSLADKLD